ncbi:hypothetical protein BDP27DRAFT_1417105 [Rhodocollybia butyracea]|uniref:Uncharacterized protein n=1 Tax=Rhodocollybia butyracea TaxID=206335 RepID=A0A9P5PW83_9AGAR|nr:hypothetical protein BDP27DRAFT_1417105 [Rhodocollybia butyracea]
MESLPDELLHKTVDYIAYAPEYDEQRVAWFRTPSSDQVIALSVVSHRLRRISLPFLFAYVFIDSTVKAERRDWCNAYPSLSKLIQYVVYLPHFLISLSLSDSRMIQFNGVSFYQDTEAELSKLWCDLLSALDGLLCIEVGRYSRLNTAILQALHDHPTLSKIIIASFQDLPQEVSLDDLSSIIIKSLESDFNFNWDAFGSYLARGLKIEHMYMDNSFLDDSQIQLLTFRGLQRISLGRCGIREPMAWLPRFVSSRPHLKAIEWLWPLRSDNIPSSLSTLMDTSDLQGLSSSTFQINSVGLSRIVNSSDFRNGKYS